MSSLVHEGSGVFRSVVYLKTDHAKSQNITKQYVTGEEVTFSMTAAHFYYSAPCAPAGQIQNYSQVHQTLRSTRTIFR